MEVEPGKPEIEDFWRA